MTLYRLLQPFVAEGENDDFAPRFSEICKIWRFLLDDFLRYVKSYQLNGAKSAYGEKTELPHFCWTISMSFGTRRFCHFIF